MYLPVQGQQNYVISRINVLNVNSSMSAAKKVNNNNKKLTHNKSAHLGQLRKKTDTINITFAQSTWAILWLPFS